jgi:hypothetical protein
MRPKRKGATGMQKVVDIVPAFRGWYARWRFTPERTISHPVAVWAVVGNEHAMNN